MDASAFLGISRPTFCKRVETVLIAAPIKIESVTVSRYSDQVSLGEQLAG